MKSMCHDVRRNSPSVAVRSPASRWSATTSRMAASSTSRRPGSSSSRAWCRARASRSSGGRSRLPTWSARNGGSVLAAMQRTYLNRQRRQDSVFCSAKFSSSRGCGRRSSGTGRSGGSMADVLLFHHVQGLTPGIVAFADSLREAGHTVHTPDLFDGRTFDSIQDGAAFSQGDGAPDFDKLADEAAASLPAELVYAGFSSGVMHAQRLAQTRAGATGALL